MALNDKNTEIDDLLISFLGDELSNEEKESVIQWINESEENKNYFHQLKEAWILTSVNHNPYHIQKEKNWNKINDRIRPKQLNLWPRFLRIAAIFIIAFAVGAVTTWLVRNSEDTEKQLTFHEIKVPLGSQTELTLPDGTKVWLNSGSRLSYPGFFKKNNRQVKLEGEAFFEVVTNKKKPFIVDAQGVMVKALGTKFNVKAYKEEDVVRTTLIEGLVTIKNERYNLEEIYLKPNQVASVQKNGKDINLSELDEKGDNETIVASKEGLVLKKLEDPRPMVSWKEEEWIIKNQAFDELAKNLERRYDVSIEFEDTELKKFRFTGVIKDESLEQVLQVIHLTTPLEYAINGKHVVFKEDKASKELYRELYDQ
jgi:ferric-dicitrate binding protein FerR (iron transport regulator)